MSTLTIGQLLTNAGETEMTYLPGVARAIRLVSVVEVEDTRSASEMLELLRLNDPDVLNMTLAEIVRPKAKSAGHNCMSIIMSAMLIVMSLAFTATIIYTSIKTGNPLQIEEMFLPLSGPLLTVLYERGLLSKENRGMIQAITGMTPMTIGEAITQRIANGPVNKTTHVIEETTETTPTSNGDIVQTKSRRVDY